MANEGTPKPPAPAAGNTPPGGGDQASVTPPPVDPGQAAAGGTNQPPPPAGSGQAAADSVDQLPEWAKKLIGDLRGENAGHRTAKKKAESDVQAAERKAAEEQGEYKKLYEAAVAKQEEAEAKAKGLELDALKTKVAAAVKLPAELAGRLQGETEEELTEDAKLLAAALPKPSFETDAVKGTGGDGGPPELTDADKLEFANRFGVDPQYVEAASFQLPKK